VRSQSQAGGGRAVLLYSYQGGSAAMLSDCRAFDRQTINGIESAVNHLAQQSNRADDGDMRQRAGPNDPAIQPRIELEMMDVARSGSLVGSTECDHMG